MADYRSVRASSLTPYVAGEQPDGGDIIKLNTNENPYPPAPEVEAAIGRAMGRLPLYPPADGGELRREIALYHGVDISNVFVGNGSDEVLALSFLAFFDDTHPVRAPELTYSFYPVYAKLFGVPYTVCPMMPGLVVDVDSLLLDGAVVIANPNAPTSIALPVKVIEKMADTLMARGELLLVDEAYVDFGGESADGLIGRYDNLLVVRTMSKAYSLAGLRVGYALGQPNLINALFAVKDSFNSYPLDRLAIAGGAAAIRDVAYLRQNTRTIMETRDSFLQYVRSIGFDAPDSSTNFVFIRHPSFTGEYLFTALRGCNILVRHFNREPIQDYLRVSIGTPEQMHVVAHSLKDIIGG